MQRLFNLSKWRRLVEGQSLNFDADRPRVVRIEVNSRNPVGLYLFDAKTGEALFLASSCGRDTVEFHCGGSFALVSDGECFIYTADGESIHHEAVDPVIFTRITERRQVNPDLIAIQRMMNQNIERRLEAQRNEFNAILRGFAASQAVSAGRLPDTPVKPLGAGDAGAVPAASPDDGDAGSAAKPARKK